MLIGETWVGVEYGGQDGGNEVDHGGKKKHVEVG